MTERRLNGRHVLAMFVCGFSIIIGVNVTLAVNAVKTFPGLEVANSYVASQSFDARRSAQQALGWTARVSYDDGLLQLTVTDAAGRVLDASGFAVVIGRPTTQVDDRPLVLPVSGGLPVDLAPGRWRVDLRSTGDSPAFNQSLSLWVAS